jgi:hypothetical protein
LQEPALSATAPAQMNRAHGMPPSRNKGAAGCRQGKWNPLKYPDERERTQSRDAR